MWSEELQMQTKDHFEKMPFACMKHFGDLRFGVCALIDGKYVITEHTTNVKYKFNSVNALIEDGWAID